MLQKNLGHRPFGMNRRNLGSMYGGAMGIPAFWIQAVHAEIGIAEESFLSGTFMTML